MRRVFRSHRQFLWILVLSLAKGLLGRVERAAPRAALSAKAFGH